MSTYKNPRSQVQIDLFILCLSLPYTHIHTCAPSLSAPTLVQARVTLTHSRRELAPSRGHTATAREADLQLEILAKLQCKMENVCTHMPLLRSCKWINEHWRRSRTLHGLTAVWLGAACLTPEGLSKMVTKITRKSVPWMKWGVIRTTFCSVPDTQLVLHKY